MSIHKHISAHRLAVQLAMATLAVLGVAAPTLLPAQTNGMERRDDRQDTREECRETEGAGKDKRDCKQEERYGRDDDDNDNDDKDD